MGIPDHLSFLWNMYTSQESIVRTGHGKMDWFQIGKGIGQGDILSPCLFNLYAEWKWKPLSQVQLFMTPWAIYTSCNSPGQNTGMGSLSLLQGIFPTQVSNRGLLHCRKILYQLSYQGSLSAEHIMWNVRLNEAQAVINIAGKNINNLRYADDITLMAESEEELKSLLMKVKRESEKADLKLNVQKTKITASGPITSWQIDGETMETVTDIIFLGSKITADSDCSHEIKQCWLLGRKTIANLDSVLKSRDITLPTKRSVWPKLCVFSSSHVQMWEMNQKEGWMARNDAFQLWHWRLFRVPWTARRSNQSILKEINPEHSLEGLKLKLKLKLKLHWCEVPTHWKRRWCWERLRAGRDVGNRGGASWMASPTQRTWAWANCRRCWRTGKPGGL